MAKKVINTTREPTNLAGSLVVKLICKCKQLLSSATKFR